MIQHRHCKKEGEFQSMNTYESPKGMIIPITKESDFPLLDVSDVIALEKQIEAAGTSLLTLMKRAGAAIAEIAEQSLEDTGSIVILSGNGNNGGDGWIAANMLAKNGYPVDLLTSKDPEEIKAQPALEAIEEISEALPKIMKVHVEPATDDAKEIISKADVIIDALLGTGFNGESVKEPFASWIELANNSDACIISADVPSGLSAQNGSHAEPTIIADATVTMLAVKPGLIDDLALSFTGNLYLAELNGDED